LDYKEEAKEKCMRSHMESILNPLETVLLTSQEKHPMKPEAFSSCATKQSLKAGASHFSTPPEQLS